MGPTIMMLVMLAGVVLYCFLKFNPYHDKMEQVKTFNAMILFICALLCLGWYLTTRMDWAGTQVEKYTALLGIGGAALIEIVFLTVFFFIRNFWMFKPKNPTWRP